MATHHPIRKTVAHPEPVIPDKLYFRIGDVARICEVPAYVLRFWETEFPNLKPNKGGTGQRLYRRKEVETALRIKHLLYDLGYTIPGARQVFKTDAKPEAKAETVAAAAAQTVESSAEPRGKTVVLGEARGAAAKENAAAKEIATQPAGASVQRLQALREELLALHGQLSAPVAVVAAVEPLRPQLVAEPKRPRLHKTEPKSEPRMGPIALAGQQDLFSAE